MTLAVVSALICVGCSSSPPEDATVKAGSGEIMNPGGKPQTEQQAALANQMQQAGASLNAERVKEATAMAEAQRRAGGK